MTSALETNYSMSGEVLGQGSFGEVRRAVHRASGTSVAIKTIDKASLSSTARKRIGEEVAILRSLQHDGICQVKEVLEDVNKIYLVLEHANGGDLYEYVNKHGRLSEREVRPLMWQMCLALKHCHDNMVVHHDIKLENIMLHYPPKRVGGSESGDSSPCVPHGTASSSSSLIVGDPATANVKLVDFGFAVRTYPGEMLSKFSGTEAYAAPELLAGKAYDGVKADIYSLGVVLYILLTAKYPFSEDVETQCEEQLSRTYLSQLEYPKSKDGKQISKEAKDLIAAFLDPTPIRRLGWVAILGHPFFGDLRKREEEEVEKKQKEATRGKLREELVCSKGKGKEKEIEKRKGKGNETDDEEEEGCDDEDDSVYYDEDDDATTDDDEEAVKRKEVAAILAAMGGSRRGASPSSKFEMEKKEEELEEGQEDEEEEDQESASDRDEEEWEPVDMSLSADDWDQSFYAAQPSTTSSPTASTSAGGFQFVPSILAHSHNQQQQQQQQFNNSRFGLALAPWALLQQLATQQQTQQQQLQPHQWQQPIAASGPGLPPAATNSATTPFRFW